MPKDPDALKELRKKLFHGAQTGDTTAFSSSTLNDRKALVLPASSDTVLHVAARNGHLNVMRAILEDLGLTYLLTSANQDGKCALHEAAQNRHLDAARYLIEQGTAVDVLKRADWTPLMLACTRDHSSEVIELLLREGAQASLRNKDGWTAFHIATRTGCVENLDILLKHDPNLWNTRSNNYRTPLHTAAIHGNQDALGRLLALSSSLLDSEDSCGSTPLMDAARFGSKECCSLLVSAGARIEQMDHVGRNVLHVAAQSGSPNGVIDFLRDQGLDVNCRTTNGQSALHLAARENQVETVRHLLRAGIDHTIRDSSGSTAGDLAAKFKSETLEHILLC